MAIRRGTPIADRYEVGGSRVHGSRLPQGEAASSIARRRQVKGPADAHVPRHAR